MNRSRLRNLYNPEHDVIADNVIPWYAVMLLNEIEKLEKVVRELDNDIAELKKYTKRLNIKNRNLGDELDYYTRHRG